MMQDIVMILMIAVFVEGLVQWFKAEYRKSKWVWASLTISAIATIATGFNPLTMFGIESQYPQLTLWFGYFMGTIILARGPNYVSDFFGSYKPSKT